MKITFVATLLIISGMLCSQEKDSLDLLQEILKPNISVDSMVLFKPDYPAGIYATKLDFIRRKPSSLTGVSPFRKKDKVEPDNDSIYLHTLFYYENTNKPVRNAFAISFKGHIFFQLRAILNNRNATDRAQKADYPIIFAMAILGGDNYMYTEAELSNHWVSNIASLFGQIGAEIAEGAIWSKGIVWDIKKQEFNIFKSCKDFNKFIEPLYPMGIQACETQQPDLEFVRKVMDSIK